MEERPVFWRAGDQSPTGGRKQAPAHPGQEQALAQEVGGEQGKPEPKPKVARKSEGPIRAETPGNLVAQGLGRAKVARVDTNLKEGNMSEARTSHVVSPGLVRVMERARRNPEERQVSLAYLIDVDALRRAYGRIRKEAAVGVDGVTKEEYGENLEDNLLELHGRLKAMKYRHQPIRRVHIPKDKNRTRPIGVSIPRANCTSHQ
jgi:hypothetical protein